MELQFFQIAIAGDGETILGLTEDGRLYYKLGSVTGKTGWRPVEMTVADEKDEETDRLLRRNPPRLF